MRGSIGGRLANSRLLRFGRPHTAANFGHRRSPHSRDQPVRAGGVTTGVTPALRDRYLGLSAAA